MEVSNLPGDGQVFLDHVGHFVFDVCACATALEETLHIILDRGGIEVLAKDAAARLVGAAIEPGRPNFVGSCCRDGQSPRSSPAGMRRPWRRS